MTAQHRWRGRGCTMVRLHRLLRSRVAPALDELVDAGTASAYVVECAACGVLGAHVHTYTAEGTESFSAYGLDIESLGIGRAPLCEELRMPATDAGEVRP